METKVVYKSTLFGKQSEVTIPYEDLTRHKESYLLNRKNFYIPVIVLGFFTLCSFMWRNDKDFEQDFGENRWIFWSILFLISIPIYLISLENLWKVRVQYNTYLFFFKNIPNKKEVDDFLECLFKTRDNYLRETYFFEPNKNIPYESQKSNFQWLRKSEVITGTEFQNSMKKLEEVFSSDLKKIGFN
ncbi:hypothetical protein [Flavobacterium sp. 102]|uniref:hypothetical protein n=1 Tax=Flavobacterium sp. 102 TaxID=2135623 RepID=UPI000EADA358|nr:hypothetical protein [Flavobacterium sp. 102]